VVVVCDLGRYNKCLTFTFFFHRTSTRSHRMRCRMRCVAVTCGDATQRTASDVQEPVEMSTLSIIKCLFSSL